MSWRDLCTQTGDSWTEYMSVLAGWQACCPGACPEVGSHAVATSAKLVQLL